MRDKFLTFVESIVESDSNLSSAIINGYLTTNPSLPKQVFNECYQAMNIFDEPLVESELEGEEPISNDSNEEDDNSTPFETIGELGNDYPIFMASVNKSKYPEALSPYSKGEYAQKNAKLYKFKDLDAGFAVADDGDIITVHNNSATRGIGRKMMQLAKKLGGSKLDHFDIPKLNEVYSAEGFKEVERYTWDDQYAPEGWDYKELGRPDVIMRTL